MQGRCNRYRFSVLCFFLSAGLCFAQNSSGGGTIQGTVRDSQGLAFPKAIVKITHTATGRTSNTTANADGYFTTPNLSIGRYKVRVESQGMRSWEGDVVLETGRTTEISPVLSPGQVTETITVTETVPLVTTTDATDGSILDARRIAELPVNGRELNTLIADVTPGVEEVIDVNGGVRTAGMMVYSTTYVQDGAASNNREFGGSMNIQGLESIGEVRVETSTSSARTNSPASVIVTTKSGTNRLRGGVRETLRNNAFGVARARQDVFFDGRPFQTPKLIRNEFGGSIGGPVMLPSFGLNGKRFYDGRNRTFFFFSREGTELRQGLTRDFTTPTIAMRQGDFSGLFDSQGRKIQLYDPLTGFKQTTATGRLYTVRLPFQDNRLPLQRMSPLAKRIYGITPLPTDIANPYVVSNLKVVTPTNGFPNVSNDPTTAKVDHVISRKDNFFVKFNGSRRATNFIGTGGATGAPTANSEANVTFLPMEALAGSMSWNHMFSNSFFVETLVSRTAQTTRTVTGPVDKDWAADLGLPNPRGEVGWPSVLNVDFMQYVEGDNRRSLKSLVSTLSQNYSWIRKTHNVKFGWSAFREKQVLLPDQGNISGTVYFDSLATALENPSSSVTAPTAQPQTGSNSANFFLGYASRFDIGLKRGLLRVSDGTYAMYLEDNYKMNSRLTLTPGIRWDMTPAFHEDNYLISAFDREAHTVMLPQSIDYYNKLGVTSAPVMNSFARIGMTFKSATELGRSPDIFQSNNFDFSPRMGFAYRALTGKRTFIIRGGYGIYLSAMAMRTLLAQFSGAAPFRATFSYQPNSAASSPDSVGNYLMRNEPYYVAGQNSGNAVDMSNPNTLTRGSTGVVGLGQLPSMKVHEWNLALEKQIRQNMVFRIRYNGRHAVNADQLNEINPAPTTFVWETKTGTTPPTGEFASVAQRAYDNRNYGSVRILEKTGFLNSSTFTLEMERRFSKGLGFQFFHTMTNAFRAAGNSFRDGIGATPDVFLPGDVPTDLVELNRFLNYRRDSGVPKHRTRWNWNYDLPVGRGKLIARNARGLLQNLIGGWKLAGTGTIVSSWYALPTNNWGEIGDFEVYGKKHKILDCRSTPAAATRQQDERCFEGYFYFNGYISERFRNSTNAAGLRNGVYGLPADYKPAMKPIIPWPKDGLPGQPGSADWDTNNVFLRVSNSPNLQRVAKDTGLHPWRNQVRLGPFNWTTDASLLKYFALRERIGLRMNFDVFNVFNTQGLNTPAADGIVTLQNSYGGFGFRPRQVQVTARLEW